MNRRDTTPAAYITCVSDVFAAPHLNGRNIVMQTSKNIKQQQT